jgi:His-Xaa-Ser system radical SAM maturase HxsC
MIPLRLEVAAEAPEPFVTRLKSGACGTRNDSLMVHRDAEGAVFAGANGLLVFDRLPPEGFEDDVVLVDPVAGRAERLIRSGSNHNSLLVTERCDQLCVMCSQPPKKTHVDRFALLGQASLLAPPGATIGITGGEPTLYKEQLFGLIEKAGAERPDLGFHVLSNGQHFECGDIIRMRSEPFRNVTWGIPLYSADPELHDSIVGKAGAFERLHASLSALMRSGARVELRTVLMQTNAEGLSALATHVSSRLRFVAVWSIMQLEHIGFAKNRWDSLYFDHRSNFGPVRQAIDRATVHGIAVRLFNFPRCSVPADYRALAATSISDWKRKYMPDCDTCAERDSCTGFFEWHPADHPSAKVFPL